MDHFDCKKALDIVNHRGNRMLLLLHEIGTLRGWAWTLVKFLGKSYMWLVLLIIMTDTRYAACFRGVSHIPIQLHGQGCRKSARIRKLRQNPLPSKAARIFGMEKLLLPAWNSIVHHACFLDVRDHCYADDETKFGCEAGRSVDLGHTVEAQWIGGRMKRKF